MPAEFWTEAARMTTSGLLVVTGVLPVAFVARALRPKDEPFLPRWKPWRVPWSGFEVAIAFIVLTVAVPTMVNVILNKGGFFEAVYDASLPSPEAKDVPAEQLKEAATVRMLWTSLFALPISLSLLWLGARMLYPKWKLTFAGNGSLGGKIWLAILAWLVLTPTILVLNQVVNEISLWYNMAPEHHSLTTLGNRPVLDQVLFVIQACVIAPLSEELFFRGILLPWCVGRMRIPGVAKSPLTDARPWFVMFATLVLAVAMGDRRVAPVIFVAILAIGLAIVWRYTHTGARRVRAVYATAALFAIVHVGVWPSPVPLFPFALGLGWLAVRTNGILVPFIVHGLFNAVSVVYVLRGGVG